MKIFNSIIFLVAKDGRVGENLEELASPGKLDRRTNITRIDAARRVEA